MSVHRVKISSDSVVETVVHPTWVGTIEKTREDDSVYYRDRLTGDFKFIGADYALINSVPDCERIEIFLEERCGETWTEQWRGKFTTYDVKFNENKCIATVRPELVDKYECFINQVDEEYVIAELEIVEVRNVRGNYQAGAQCCTTVISDDDPTPTDPVCDVPDGYCFDKNTRWEIPLSGSSTITSCFHRVRGVGVSNVIPPPYGDDWTFLVEHLGVFYWWRCPIDGEVTLGPLSYGRLFNDAMEDMITQAECSLTVRSHFFGLNNTHTAPPDNIAYDYATEYLQTLTIHQKSDVKCPKCSNQAENFVWKITWRKLLDDLRTMMNVYWVITDDDELIIEHQSYFAAIAGLDVSDQNIAIDYGKGETSAPNIEKFFWADDASFTAEHLGEPISYGDCGNGTKDHRMNLFSNDIFYIRQVENQSEISDTGFCLVCTETADGLYYVRDFNNPLGWPMLHDNLHRHYRYFENGIMNGEEETFLSVRKTRKMKPFNLNVCCDDGFNPEDYITMSAGQVTVEKAVVNYFSGKDNRVVTIEALI